MDNLTTITESILMLALATLTPTQLSALTTTLSSTLHHHRHRLASLLSSPTLFTHTLNHLHSLSLPQKSLLISHHLLSFFHLLKPYFPTLPSYTHRPRLRDLDSVLLLLLFCEVRQSHPRTLETSPVYWRETLLVYCSDTMLGLSSFPVSSYDVLGAFVDIVVKCRRFVTTKGCDRETSKREIPTSVAVIVALPSVEVKRGGDYLECTICKDELDEGRDLCELPCKHLFHWMCVLPWLCKRNTCPCCRFRLPTDDVYEEIERFWDVIRNFGQGTYDHVDLLK